MGGAGLEDHRQAAVAHLQNVGPAAVALSLGDRSDLPDALLRHPRDAVRGADDAYALVDGRGVGLVALVARGEVVRSVLVDGRELALPTLGHPEHVAVSVLDDDGQTVGIRRPEAPEHVAVVTRPSLGDVAVVVDAFVEDPRAVGRADLVDEGVVALPEDRRQEGERLIAAPVLRDESRVSGAALLYGRLVRANLEDVGEVVRAGLRHDGTEWPRTVLHDEDGMAGPRLRRRGVVLGVHRADEAEADGEREEDPHEGEERAIREAACGVNEE